MCTKKICKACGDPKPLSQFYARKKKTRAGIRMYPFNKCQDCVRTIHRLRYQPKYKRYFKAA